MKRLVWLVLCGVTSLALVASAEQGGKADKAPKGERFAKADADGDGKLSAAEFATMVVKGDATQKFAAADTDQDGFLTRDEMAAAKGKAKNKKAEAPAPL